MISINPVIRTLIVSDLFVLAGIGLFNPILAIFVTQHIQGGDVQVVGFAVAIYFAMWVFQIPVGKYLDRNHGDRDDFWFLLAGSFLTSAVPFLYLFASLPWHVYALQALMGLGRAIDLPPWFALFTRRIDKTREGFDWSVENVVAGLGLAVTGALGGTVAKWYGFEAVFIFAGILSVIGSSVLLLLYKYTYQEEKIIP
mgnify:CR=1 FL=1